MKNKINLESLGTFTSSNKINELIYWFTTENPNSPNRLLPKFCNQLVKEYKAR